jgi:hypothetical protein
LKNSVDSIADVIGRHFAVLDESIEQLAKMHEGEVTSLFAWILNYRVITIGVTKDGTGLAIRVIPASTADFDTIEVVELADDDDLSNLLAPLKTPIPVSRLGSQSFLKVGGMQVVETNNPLATPAFQFEGFVGFGRMDDVSQFSEDAARKTAVDEWNRALAGTPKQENFVIHVTEVLQRLRHLPKRKAFLERRIHRFIDAHSRIILPPHRDKYFEHKIRCGEEVRKADFVLQREAGMRPLLIELESPHCKVFRKDGEFTQAVNHARHQISEWVSFIDCEPQSNAAGDFAFLAGPKDRLIIIGKGLEHRDRLLATRRDDTLVWTYDLLLEEAIGRLNECYSLQCQIVGLPAQQPFK